MFYSKGDGGTPTLRSCRALRLISGLGVAIVTAACGSEVENGQPRTAKAPVALMGTLANTPDEVREAIASAEPGDVIRLADGNWKDFEILFEGRGVSGAPITLTAQTPGGVVLTGQSNLRLAGEHLVVDGLVFRDGYTPTSSVIAFAKSDTELANHSVVRNTVIDGFTNPERFETDTWVQIFGRNNHFENNHLAGKGNQGVTLAVRLNTEASRDNAHVIANNYFGPRINLGSNGGETLRIGTSHHSLSDSNTVVENNVFDRTNGELEVVSVKSGGNVVRGNTFLAARGTLTLRHGSGNTLERNVFLGEGAEHTGGIRVINGDQTVRGNYMEALTGIRFGGAFTIMNGVPDSPINRYHQVTNAVIEHNSIIGSDRIQLGAGSDTERSAVPVDSVFRANLIARDIEGPVFETYDDMSGIAFTDNVVAGPGEVVFEAGFTRIAFDMARESNGLLYPPEDIEAGAPRDLKVTRFEDVGVTWYPKKPRRTQFGSGKRVEVPAEDGALFNALHTAEPGDLLALAPGRHKISKLLTLDRPVTLSGGGEAVVTFERPALFQIENGGSLRLEGLEISGESAPDMVGNAVIRTSPYSMIENYRLEVSDTVIRDLDVNRFFDVVRGAKSTMADRILFDNVTVDNISGTVFNLDDEIDDFGRYNAEYVTVVDSTFRDVQGPLATLYRGGRDESTFGPHFELRGSRLENVGMGSRNALGASLRLHGVQDTDIVDNDILASAPFFIEHTVGDPQTDVTDNRFAFTPAPILREITSGLAPTARLARNSGL